MSRLIAKFNQAYAARPLITMMVSNAILGGMADATAQTITAVRENALRKTGGVTKNDPLAREIHELDKAQEAAGGTWFLSAITFDTRGNWLTRHV